MVKWGQFLSVHKRSTALCCMLWNLNMQKLANCLF